MRGEDHFTKEIELLVNYNLVPVKIFTSASLIKGRDFSKVILV